MPRPKGYVMSKEHRENISKALKGRKAPNRSYWLGKKRSEEDREKFRIAKLGSKRSVETRKKISNSNKRLGRKPPVRFGKDHHNWIEDRSKLKTDRRKHYDTKYRYWMIEVKKRDNWECKIKNSDCRGRLESHHILDWENYPELRYEINNGITLCHAHHPRGRANEKRLAPVFQEMVSVSKDPICN